MFVVTADQRASTRTGDRVESLLELLRPWQAAWLPDIVLPLERTVGDEVQIVLGTPDAAVDLALRFARAREWAVGIGCGGADQPLAASARASSGPAFVLARKAVERAKLMTEPVPVVVAGTHEGAAEAATAILQLLTSVARRRSAAGWEVADLLTDGVTQRDVAKLLKISEQAVSQRVASAMIDEERRARPVAVVLLNSAGR